MKTTMTLLLLLAFSTATAGTRVEVYENAAGYHDVAQGDSLSAICQKLKLDSGQQACQQQLLERNPAAFINDDPNRLLAGKRLWLPGANRPVSQVDDKRYKVETFSWGNVKTPK
jgi:Tfp pilus assembly protein FimV